MRSGVLQRAKVFGKDAVAGFVARSLPRSVLFDKRYFSAWEKRGFHVTLDHFYEPVPNSQDLEDHDYNNAGDLSGLDFRASEQMALLEDFEEKFSPEYEAFAQWPQAAPAFYFSNGTFEEVDAEVLYCMVRHLKPCRIVEVGSGFSTRLISAAIARNSAEGTAAPQYTVIDPYADSAVMSTLCGISELIRKPVQAVELSRFHSLGAGDILFIDSSHVLKTASDVQFEFLHVLPGLRPGVSVHVHDVFLPNDYPRTWLVNNRWFWSEQYLLQAFLSFNDRFEIVWAGHYMHRNYPAALASAFSSYRNAARSGDRHWPASFWMRRIA